MSFRSRLSLFFVLIVVVPMMAVGLVVFRLISDSQNGKADARVSEGRAAAIGIFRASRDRADTAAVALARDGRLIAALRSGNDAVATARSTTLLRTEHLQRIRIRWSPVAVDVGARDAIAPVERRLQGAGGRAVGTLTVSELTVPVFARTLQRDLGLDVVVTRTGSPPYSTDKDLRNVSVPDSGTIDAGGVRYRVRSFEAPHFDGQKIRVAVLADTDAASSAITNGRLLALGILGGFLLLAFAFAIAVSRSLQAQIGRFLEAAQRLGGGDFSTPVPTAGHDEFAALGNEFNKMSKQLEGRLAELQTERERLQQAIQRIGETFASNLDRDGLLEIVTRTAVDSVDADCGRATARDDPTDPLSEHARVGSVEQFGDAVRAAEAEALKSGESAEVEVGGISAIAYPLRRTDGRAVLGLISVARASRAFTTTEHELFDYLAGQAAVSIQNVGLHEQVQRQAVTDELTGLFNHRRFQEVMTAEVERARRFDQDLGLVILDIDDFKAVNDTYGHQQGDLVLRHVAQVVRDASREVDEPARYGGEEMTVALPQTDLEGATTIAERIRAAVEALEIPLLDGQGTLKITASLGAAALPTCATGKAELIAVADAALYQAKRHREEQGRRARPRTRCVLE